MRQKRSRLIIRSFDYATTRHFVRRAAVGVSSRKEWVVIPRQVGLDIRFKVFRIPCKLITSCRSGLGLSE